MQRNKGQVTTLPYLAGQPEVVVPQVQSPIHLVLLGPPGVGKGTQAELLSRNLAARHLSTGDILRSARNLDPNERSPAISAALKYMQRGDLVPDSTILALVEEHLDYLSVEQSFLLDGFPRTVGQAWALDRMLERRDMKLDAVISYELPVDRIVQRLSGRRTCPACKSVFHISARPPRKRGVCDHCGSRLIQREDDRPVSIRVRLAAYEDNTAPLAELYARRGLLVRIPAEGSPEEVFGRSLEILQVA